MFAEKLEAKEEFSVSISAVLLDFTFLKYTPLNVCNCRLNSERIFIKRRQISCRSSDPYLWTISVRFHSRVNVGGEVPI